MPNNQRLNSMTTAEKLEAMEALWSSLCQNPSEVESPEWHRQILDARRARIAAGETTFTDWEIAKERIRVL